MRYLAPQRNTKAKIGYVLTKTGFTIFILLILLGAFYQSAFAVLIIGVGIALGMGNDYIMYKEKENHLIVQINKDLNIYKDFKDLKLKDRKFTFYTNGEMKSYDVSNLEKEEVEKLIKGYHKRKM